MQAHACTHVTISHYSLCCYIKCSAQCSEAEPGVEAEAETDLQTARHKCESSAWPATLRIKLGISFTFYLPNIPLLLFSFTKSRVRFPESGNPLQPKATFWLSQQDSLQTGKWNKLPSRGTPVGCPYRWGNTARCPYVKRYLDVPHWA